MRTKDKNSLFGGLLLIFAIISTVIFLRPAPREIENQSHNIVGEESVYFTQHFGKVNRQNAVFEVQNGNKCILYGRGGADDPVLKLQSILKPSSHISIQCERRPGIDGSHPVRALQVDGDVLLSIKESRINDDWNRGFHRTVSIFA